MQITIPILKMPYTDAGSMAQYPDAVWRPALTTINGLDFAAGVESYAYVNQADLEAGATPIPGAQHHTAVPTPVFVQAMAQAAASGTNLAVIAGTILQICQTVPDTATGAKNPDGSPVMAAFFANASIVMATITLQVGG
jgi:hypothetical protein